MAPNSLSLSHRLPYLLTCVALLALPLIIVAQETAEKAVAQPRTTTAPGKATATATPGSKETSAAAKAKTEQQKALAVSLLVALTKDARSFTNQKLRARTLSRIADALWEVDPSRAARFFAKPGTRLKLPIEPRAGPTKSASASRRDPNAPVAMVGAPTCVRKSCAWRRRRSRAGRRAAGQTQNRPDARSNGSEFAGAHRSVRHVCLSQATDAPGESTARN